MAFAAICNTFFRIEYDAENNVIYAGTNAFVKRSQLESTKVEPKPRNELDFDRENLRLYIDIIALSNIIYGITSPDAIDNETLYKSAFFSIYQQIATMFPEAPDNWTVVVEDYFQLKYVSDVDEQIDLIIPRVVYRNVKTVASKGLLYLLEPFLPIESQTVLNDILLSIIEMNYKEKFTILEELMSGDFSSFIGKVATDMSGRVMASKGYWSAYRWLVNNGLENEVPNLIETIVAKAMQSPRPLFDLRSTIVQRIESLDLEDYTSGSYQDLATYKSSLQTASDFKELWYYAVRMKGLIYELAFYNLYYNKYYNLGYYGFEYRAEADKKSLSQIIGSEQYSQLVKVLSSHVQLQDPVPDFFHLNINDDGLLELVVFEVGWVTDITSKKTGDYEKWEPFLGSHKEMNLAISLEQLYSSSREQETWPLEFLKSKTVQTWVKTMKSIFYLLHMSPEDELEIEESILSSTVVRKLLRKNAKLFCPLMLSDLEARKELVLKSLNREFTANDFGTGLNWTPEFFSKFSLELKDSIETDRNAIADVNQINRIIRSNNLLDNIEFSEPTINDYYQPFRNEEETLQATQLDLFSEAGYKEFKIVKYLSDKELSPTSASVPKRSRTFIDNIVTLSIPGMTTNEKTIRRLWSTFYLLMLGLLGFECYSDRLYRICYVASGYQNVGGKVNVEKTSNTVLTEGKLKDTIEKVWKVTDKHIREIIFVKIKWLTLIKKSGNEMLNCLTKIISIMSKSFSLPNDEITTGLFSLKVIKVDNERLQDLFNKLKNGFLYLEQVEAEFDTVMLDKSVALCYRDKKTIDLIHECLGHETDKKKVIDLITNRISGNSSSRNNPSIKHSIIDVLAYTRLQFNLEENLTNLGRELIGINFSHNTESSLYSSNIFINLDMTVETLSSRAKADWLIFKQVFNFSNEGTYKYLTRLSYRKITDLMYFKSFRLFCILSILARLHLQMKSKFNGLKDISMNHLGFILYIYQPKNSKDDKTPCVLKIHNEPPVKFNMDYSKSKLWLSLPYMASLMYNELLQEYDIYDNSLDYSSVQKLVFQPELSTNQSGPLTLLINGLSSSELIESLKALTQSKQNKIDLSQSSDIKSLINYLLIVGILNFSCKPVIYNNKQNNEFRQALRFIYGSNRSFCVNKNLGKKFSHITRYSVLYLDKVIGLLSSHSENATIVPKLENNMNLNVLHGPCYLGFLPIINERVMTTCMFICHMFNKAISNYDEALLKTIDGLFEIPLKTFTEFKNYDQVNIDLALGSSSTILMDRVTSCLSNIDNSSKIVVECLNYGCLKLKEKLSIRGFKGFETAPGLHNNFMDVSEVTNCISRPRLHFDLYNSCDILLRTKFNKVIKYGTNTRSKRQDVSFVETLLTELDSIISELSKNDQEKFKNIMLMHTKRKINISEITLESWMDESNPQLIISHCKNVFSSTCKAVKDVFSDFFQQLDKIEVPAEIYDIYADLSELICPPHISDNVADKILKADLECEILYKRFEKMTNEIKSANKFLSLESVRNDLRASEEQFNREFKNVIDFWFQYLLVVSSMTPTCLAAGIKNQTIREFLMTDEKVVNYEFRIWEDDPEILTYASAPFLSRYIAGCLISKVRLYETHVTLQSVPLSEMGSAIRRFVHNNDSKILFNEMNRFFTTISHGNWKTGCRLLNSWMTTGLPRSTRTKVIFEAIKMSASYNTHSVASVALTKIKMPTWFYFAGVAPKAQLGGLRDLLVQEFDSKIILHISEQLSLYALTFLENDILGHPNAKDIALNRVTEIKTDPQFSRRHFFICGDKKKWAQKHSTLFFYKMINTVFGNSGWCVFLLMVLLEGLKKSIEIPTAFTEHYIRKIQKLGNYKHLRKDEVELFINELSNDIPEYHKILLIRLLNNKNYINLFTHMGQGIYHKMSSLYGHAAELFAIDLGKARLKDEGFSLDVQYWRSSDDYMQIVVVLPDDPTVSYSVGDIARLYFKTYVAGMHLCNIRESEKTIVTPRFGEIYSTYASSEIIPAPVKFYVPNMMIGSSFTPLDLWRTRFAKMQQMFDNGTSLSTINLYSLLDVQQIERFFQKDFFVNKIKLPNLCLNIIPHLSDVVFGTLSNSEFKCLLEVARSERVSIQAIQSLTELLHDLETPKSKLFFEMSNTDDSLLREIYRLPFSKKYNTMKTKMVELIEENLEHVFRRKGLNLNNTEDISALQLLSRSSKLDSSVGEDYRFVSALNSKNIIWGLTGGTREDSIQMLRQTVIGDYRDKSLVVYYDQVQSKIDMKTMSKFVNRIKSYIQYPTELFDENLKEFSVKHKNLRSLYTPMKKVFHYYQSSSQVFTNTIEQILTYLKEPDVFMELRPRLNNAELIEYDVEKLTFLLGKSRNEIKGISYNDLLMNLHENRSSGHGIRQSIMTFLYDSDWKDIPKSALHYNTIRPWILDTSKVIVPIMSNISEILNFVLQIMSCVANFSGNDHVKRKIARKFIFSPEAYLPMNIQLNSSIFHFLVRLRTTLPPMSSDRKQIETIFDLLIDNIGETVSNVHALYEDQHFLSRVKLGSLTIDYITLVSNNISVSLITYKETLLVKSNTSDSSIIPMLHSLVKQKLKNQYMNLKDSIDYLIKNNSRENTVELKNLYQKANATIPLNIHEGRITDLRFTRNHPMRNFTILVSLRQIPRTFKHLDESKRLFTYLSINNASWKKMETIERDKTDIEMGEDFRAYMSGRHIKTLTETRLVKQLACLQWIDFNVAQVIKTMSTGILSSVFSETEIDVLPKLRISQIVEKDSLEGITSDMGFFDEQFLYKSGTYIVDLETMLVETIEVASSIHSILMNPETALYRAETTEKLPAFMSPYLLTDYDFSYIQGLFLSLLRNLKFSEEICLASIFLEILKSSPRGDLQEGFSDLINEPINTWFFSLYLKVHQIMVYADGDSFIIKINKPRNIATDIFSYFGDLEFVEKHPNLYKKSGPYTMILKSHSGWFTIYEFILGQKLLKVTPRYDDTIEDFTDFIRWVSDMCYYFITPTKKNSKSHLDEFSTVILSQALMYVRPIDEANYNVDDDEDDYYVPD